jgi:hypothetical protein
VCYDNPHHHRGIYINQSSTILVCPAWWVTETWDTVSLTIWCAHTQLDYGYEQGCVSYELSAAWTTLFSRAVCEPYFLDIYLFFLDVFLDFVRVPLGFFLICVCEIRVSNAASKNWERVSQYHKNAVRKQLARIVWSSHSWRYGDIERSYFQLAYRTVGKYDTWISRS